MESVIDSTADLDKKLNKYFILGNNLNQRDVIAVRKTVSGSKVRSGIP